VDKILRSQNVCNAMTVENQIVSQIGMAINQLQKAKKRFDEDPNDKKVEDDLIAGLDFLVMALRLYRNYHASISL